MERRETNKLLKILDERLKYHWKNPGDGKSWEKVRSGLKKKFGI
ncbi:MAG: hypothetical protein ABJ092_02030 [Gillisia sp.]